MLDIYQTVAPNSRTTRGSAWIATATVDGRTYDARSRSGAPFALARILVDAGVADQPVRVTQAGLAGHVAYRSLHRMAELATGEGQQPIRLARWRDPSTVWAKTG